MQKQSKHLYLEQLLNEMKQAILLLDTHDCFLRLDLKFMWDSRMNGLDQTHFEPRTRSRITFAVNATAVKLAHLWCHFGFIQFCTQSDLSYVVEVLLVNVLSAFMWKCSCQIPTDENIYILRIYILSYIYSESWEI